MYIIAVYDINEKRVVNILKIFRKYLTWIQKSVFEGELTEGQFAQLKAELKKKMNSEEDSVIFFSTSHSKWIDKEVLGLEKNPTNNIL